MRDVVDVPFTNYEDSVPEALDACGAGEFLASRERVLVKPNLVSKQPPPVTTPAACVEVVVRYVREHAPGAEVLVAEGTGCASETSEVFEDLGYVEMAQRLGVELVDLNLAPLVHREDPQCGVFKEMWLPELAFTHTIVSVPVLKGHSMSMVTGALKNMMGFPPPAHYAGGPYGSWKKARFHHRLHEAIRDLCRYVSPALCLVDASEGLLDYHLGGPRCDPPVRKILAGGDPLAVDRACAGLLGIDWREVAHLAD